jgi:hypothetical protein
MDELIVAIAKAFRQGATIQEIHDACVEQNIPEDHIFLAIYAGKNLFQAQIQQEEELKKRPASFGRK